MTDTYSLATTGRTLGPRLYIRHGNPQLIFEILGLEDIEFPDTEPERIDVSHMGSPGGVGEEINGPRSASSYTLDLQHWPNADHEAELRALAETQEVVEFLIDMGGTLRAFAAKVMHFEFTNIPMAGKVMVAAKFSIMAEIDNPVAIPG